MSRRDKIRNKEFRITDKELGDWGIILKGVAVFNDEKVSLKMSPILMVIALNPGIQFNQMMEWIPGTRSSLDNSIKRLRAKGLIESSPSKEKGVKECDYSLTKRCRELLSF